MGRHGKRRRLRGVLVMLVSLGTALAAAELWVRSMDEVERGFAFRDGNFVRPVEFDVPEVENALGFHDVEHGPKAPGTRRILLVGDSYVAAYSVEVEETVGRRMEHHLRRLGATDHGVVAVGKSGWCQREELAALRRLGEELAPDHVVLLFLPLNDVRENSDELTERFRLQMPELVQYRPGWAAFSGERAPLFLVEGSYLNRWLSYRLAIRGSRTEDAEVPLDYLVYSTEPDPAWEEAWRITERRLKRMRAHADELGATFAIACASTPQGVHGADEGLAMLRRTYPRMAQGSWDLDGPRARLERFCADQGIPFTDLEAPFRERIAAEGARLHWPIDGHWNAAGNDYAGELLARFVLATRR